MNRVRAKKHLGQHFLNDDGIADNIAKSIDLELTEGRILEIGPGTGILTRAIQRAGAQNLKLIEIDDESVFYLKENYPALSPNLIHDDFLRIEINKIFGDKPFILAGNFPYNISSQILFRVFENHEVIPQMVGMFQKEVAERVGSPPGNKTYGILSVLLGIYYTAEYLFTVHEGSFNPPPKVKSGILRLTRNERKDLGISDAFFKSVVKSAFNQRRKTLRNSLSSFIPGEKPEHLLEVLSLRPEQLSPNQFLDLAKELHTLQAQ